MRHDDRKAALKEMGGEPAQYLRGYSAEDLIHKSTDDLIALYKKVYELRHEIDRSGPIQVGVMHASFLVIREMMQPLIPAVDRELEGVAKVLISTRGKTEDDILRMQDDVRQSMMFAGRDDGY